GYAGSANRSSAPFLILAQPNRHLGGDARPPSQERMHPAPRPLRLDSCAVAYQLEPAVTPIAFLCLAAALVVVPGSN
ncbi:MAG TPA: hypothetical protein VFJ58_05295, partial [Armatimonadota bacterium]|nr:hypothetical protein [Armatimonadota bacterium]